MKKHKRKQQYKQMKKDYAYLTLELIMAVDKCQEYEEKIAELEMEKQNLRLAYKALHDLYMEQSAELKTLTRS